MILAIDQGTTATTCLVFDTEAELVGRAQREFPQHFPRPGWVEHDLEEIWAATHAAAAEALEDAGVRVGELLGVGIANQRETVCAWDPRDGTPLARAIVWQDRRTAARCDALREAGHEDRVRGLTGLTLDPYFSATKIEWLLDNVEGLRDRAGRGGAVFGTVDAWLIHRLSGESVTDPTNASRTLFYDIAERNWSGELLELFGDLDPAWLPRLGPSSGEIARSDPARLHGHAVPIAGVAGDQQAALFGQACLDPGMTKSTYGTGSFVLCHAGARRPAPSEALLATVASQVGAGVSYALEAPIFATGAAVQWLRDGLGIIAEAAETEALAAGLAGNDEVYFVPALTGLGAPEWDPYARGTIVGLTRGSTRAHLARATLEGIAHQTADAIDAMGTGLAEPLAELRADGGASANGWLMQFQADILGVPVLLPEVTETTALGAAYLAGVGIGLWTLSEVSDHWRERRRFEPAMGSDQRQSLRRDWKRALERARGWAQA